ncbi:unnamed protein product [Rotaria sordida]|uniref:ATP synthase subunit b n=1 Tax=Rotaria sordida TaxID=392033 RepID=A0A819CUE8_9BILA|nr:unnamed protein product [Rotaria sordida]CAF1112816.1 unnamed protein product [Rotaria sordida]CAF1273211.1 unnamed protein product [Rotaria sordida]CAF1326027.1 unnamed protein product [Rotaria sordida]CAF3821737.1 unnamed protein product [Rotaria sordida]
MVFSKEYIVLWYDFTEYIILAAAVIIVVKKLDPSIGNVFRDWHQEEVDRYNSVVNNSKAMAGQNLTQARKYIIYIGLETVYRERLKQIYEPVKHRLDYQLALQNARKDFERTNMINWIRNKVKQSIRDKQEKRYLTIMFTTT